jgi:RNA polymerase sigma-70 factor (ECF subfamily)
MTLHPELDDLTLARARHGDSAACRELVLRYQRPVFALLSRMLRPAGKTDRVEDLAQECFLRVFRALVGFRKNGSAKLSTWILTIASRLAIDELRRGALKRADPEATLKVPARERSDDSLRENAVRAVLEHTLETLDPELRAAFLLRAYHQLSHQEIAGSLNIPIGTVKSRIARVRAVLRERLEEVCDGA